jgi:hypothetical protein
MIVTPRVRSQKTSLAVQPLCGVSESACVCTNRLASMVQLLQKNERSSLLDLNNVSLTMSNHGANNFSVLCGAVCGAEFEPVWQAWITADKIELSHMTTPAEIDGSVLTLLAYMREQLIPMYATCCRVTARMQGAFGSVALDPCVGIEHKRVDDAFTKNNASVISRVTDVLNSSLGAHDRNLHNFQYAARLVWLGSTFCATASLAKKFSLFHASQLQVTEMSEHMVEMLYAQEPEKQHVTTLMRGADPASRISRFNVAVRFFARDSEMVRELMPQVVGLNTSITSGVVVFTGVRNNQAAAVYLSSDTQDSIAHRAAVHAYYGGGVTDKD